MTQKIQSRRTVLGSIATAGYAAFSGCLAGIRPGTDKTEQSTPFKQITVEGVHLVAELSTETSIDRLSVIEPSGKLYAERSIPPGVTRETVRFGTDYNPGEYEVRGLKEDEMIGTSTIDIRPELEIVDVKLARNYPDEMYEGAAEPAIESEVIVTVQNRGTGPDSITQLRFGGDIPRPTPDNFTQSGVYDVESELHRHRDEIIVRPNGTEILYSYSYPFSSAGENQSCESTTVHGKFTVSIYTQNSDNILSRNYDVEYVERDGENCDISILEVDP